MATAYRQALEASAQARFAGRLMNCMAHGTETWYLSPESNLTRTSTDFWPNRPESHGLHLYANAQVCTWFGQFLHGDWDMFQSDHEMGGYHAAGRAVSGSPVYCSDEPGQQNAAVLRRLVCHDGAVLRFPHPGLPGRSCRMRNPTRERLPLTIVNRSGFGAAIGVFHARYDADPASRTALSTTLDLTEVPDLEPGSQVLWRHTAGRAELIEPGSAFAVAVEHGGYEVLSLAPVSLGRAVIGLQEKFVPILGIRTLRWTRDTLEVTFRDGGEALVWCEQPPKKVSLDGRILAPRWDAAVKLLRLDLPAALAGASHVEW